jgi:NAD(P)-dependent dehydrogenase (short-subunit alcohol dehydrogenase family)
MRLNMKTIVITGSTRGIGRGLAEEFLKRDHQVVVSGRKPADVARVQDALGEDYPSDLIFGQACDVSNFKQVEALWKAAIDRYGKVDIWINNAGQAHTLQMLWEMPAELYASVVGANILGQLHGIKAAVNGMLAQGFGAIYLMEGQGATGQIIKGLGLYGSTKRGTNFLFNALTKELENSPVIVGSLQPGMVVTDLLLVEKDENPESWEKNKWVYNVLADRVEVVAPFLAEEILKNQKNGKTIKRLGRVKVLWRFLTAGITKRNVLGE